MGKPLVIVESPTKARKIAEYLGSAYAVEASVGHVRDLPKGAAEVPEAYKKEPWARTGVDTENDFKPLYIVPKEKKEQVRKLKALLKDADELYLATDEDREGESISWHLLEVLSPKVPVKRMVFHEITKKAILEAVANPRDLDLPLVDAQETRRILDRLYGYEVSPVLWKKVLPGLSAGRVQSVATRIVVQRERERMAFRSASYWGIDAHLVKPASDTGPFPASLVQIDGTRVATGRDFDSVGAVRSGVVVLDESGATSLVASLAEQTVTVRSVEEKPYRSSPKPPFMTSTLQQEAGRKLRFSNSRTMQVAQRLYENGYITYMRTDSTSLSNEAIDAARAAATRLYGADHVPAQPRRYDRKVKNAQEAHEAIRPSGDSFRMPEQVAGEVGPDEARLYELIWKRTVASQMEDARGVSVSARLGAIATDGRDAELSASGRTITFPGYLRAYVEGADDPEAALEDRETFLPALAVGDIVDVESMTANGHTTSPPARFTEASLTGRLEELGVGRPSTYASIMTTIQDRGYVRKKGQALVPTWTAFAVVGLLEKHFPHLVDFAFTARLEDDLDAIASRQAERVPWLRGFYFGAAAAGDAKTHGAGPDGDGLKTLVVERLDEIDPRVVNAIPITDDIAVRVGRYGPYLQRAGTEERASVPEDLAPDELTPQKAEELLALGNRDEEPLGADPQSGLPVYVKTGRFGAYVQLGDMVEGEDGKPVKNAPKPKRASLFRSMHPDSVSFADALLLLSLPRTLGADPADSGVITAQNGRFGPYLLKTVEGIEKGDSRSITSEDQLLTITLDDALAVYAVPKRGRGAMVRPPLKELGPDPVSGGEMVVKSGKYGEYVTDGTTNATIRGGDTVENLNAERASDLLAERRLAAPATPNKAGARKAPAKKAAGTAKKSPAAKKAAGTAKKAPAKKAAPKKASD